MKSSDFFFSSAIQIFLATCHYKSYSRAAKELGITQPAISKAINNLQNTLGFDLFYDYRPLELTPEGRRMFLIFEKTSDLIFEEISQARSNNFIKPQIRLGILESIYSLFGLEILEHLNPLCSRIQISNGTNHILTQQFHENRIDILISMNGAESKESVRKIPVGNERAIIALPKDTANKYSSWTWEKLRLCGLPLIGYHRESPVSALIDQGLAQQHFYIKPRIEVDGNELLLAMVAQNQGWAFTYPSCVLSETQLAEKVAIIDPPTPFPSRQLSVYYTKSEFQAISESVAEFLKVCLNNNKVISP